MTGRKSVMWDYIAQEPEVLRRLMDSGEIGDFARLNGEALKAVYFVAHGSSYNAAITVLPFMLGVAGLRAYAYTPANFLSNEALLSQEDISSTLVVGISQTGTSAGAIEALERAKALGFPTLGITGMTGSPIEQTARRHLPLCCGGEDSNAKTKGYSATLTLLLLLSVSLGLARGTLEEGQAQAVRDELRSMIDAIPETVERVYKWCENTGFGTDLKDLYVLGSGMNFGTAMEGQLKLMETMCIPTMFNDIGEFSHGMHRAINAESSVLLINAGGAFSKLTQDSFSYLKTVTERVLMLDASGTGRDDKNRITLPHYPHTQSVLLTALAVQVLSVYAPEQMGLDPNRDAHNDFTDFVHTRIQ